MPRFAFNSLSSFANPLHLPRLEQFQGLRYNSPWRIQHTSSKNHTSSPTPTLFRPLLSMRTICTKMPAISSSSTPTASRVPLAKHT